MDLFQGYKLEQHDGEMILILYLNSNESELSKELGFKEDASNEKLSENIKKYIKQKFPDIKITAVKLMLGSLLVASIPFGIPEASAAAPTFSSQQINSAKKVNIYIDGKLQSFQRPAVVLEATTYIPLRAVSESLGANVWWNAESRTVGIHYEDMEIAFIPGARTARVNGHILPIPPSFIHEGTTMVPVRFISETIGFHVQWDAVTQNVLISSENHPIVIPPSSNTSPSVTYTTHRVRSGENAWSISVNYGIPMLELLRLNKLTEKSTLYVNQELTIPVYTIPVQKTPSARHGEYLDWWTEAQYVFPIGKTAKVTDFQTGISFQIKRTVGANHADCEPLTAADAQIIKNIWGGNYSWKERAVIVEVEGRRIAASMSSLPHDVQYIRNNNFNGHFDLHFKNSTRHKDGKMDYNHQEQIKISAGVY